MEPSVDVVTLTVNPAVDRSAVVDRVVPEHKLRCTDPSLDPGGGGINVSRACTRLGSSSLALWCSGGATGQLLGNLLDQEGLAHDPVPIRDETRANFSVYETSSTLQYRFNLPGPTFTDACQARVFERLAALPPSTKFVVLSGSLPPGVSPDFYARAARAVPPTTRVVLDTSGPALRAALEGPIFAFKPNLRELGQLVGHEPTDDETLVAAGRELLAQSDTQVVLVSLGAGGAVLVTETTSANIRSPTVPIRSKVGAGDSMVAGFVHGLSQGFIYEEAARFAVAAGAAAVMTDGSQLCTSEDTHRLYAQMKQETNQGEN
jgi:6-phosphofructokinase 2